MFSGARNSVSNYIEIITLSSIPLYHHIHGVQGVLWTPVNLEKKSVLGHSLVINAMNCLYLYCLFSQAGEPLQFWANCESGKHHIKMATVRH